MSGLDSPTVYIVGRRASVPTVKPKHFDFPPVAGCVVAHKPRLLHVGRWAKLKTQRSRRIIFPTEDFCGFRFVKVLFYDQLGFDEFLMRLEQNE